MKKQYVDILDLAETAGGATVEVISKAEQELGVIFPLSYRQFLGSYGAAMGVGFEIAGVFSPDDEEPPMWKNIVTVTKQMRRMAGPSFSKSLLPISSDGASLFFYLDASTEEQSPVIAFGPGVDGRKVADSFEEFVIMLGSGCLT